MLGCFYYSMANVGEGSSGPTNISGFSCSTPTIVHWTAKEIKLIQDYRTYFNNSLVQLDRLASNGPLGVVFPKKPKKSIDTLLPIEVEKTVLTPEELHQYLVEHLVLDQNVVCLAVDQLYPDLQSIQPHLKTGFLLLSANSSTSLQCHLQFGLYLRQAFELFQQRKSSTHIKQSWADYLETNITGLSPSYAKQIRDLSEAFQNYPKMQRLGISFNDLYKRRKEILSMFLLNPQIDRFWRE